MFEDLSYKVLLEWDLSYDVQKVWSEVEVK